MAAEVGPCGLWPRDLGPTYDREHYENRQYHNFGCASQRNLAAMGEHKRLREERMFFQYALEDDFRALVERTLGRRTLAFISGIDTRRDVAVELFTLEPQAGDPASGNQD